MDGQSSRSKEELLTQYRRFHDIYVQLDDADRRVLQSFGLTRIQYSALLLLNAQQGLRPIDLSDRLLCARSTVTRLIDQLEQQGLVHRVSSPDDRRAQFIVLTEAGLDYRNRVQEAHEASLVERFRGFSIEEIKELNRLLDKVRLQLADYLAEH